jgi:hypothetical protein
MVTPSLEDHAVASRRSIEALRAGVPNRSAVRELGTDQKQIEAKFVDLLSKVAVERAAGRALPGFMVQGGFGSGKSHLLEWLEHVALEQGFGVSRVVVSKETPLGDPHKVFRAAIENLTLPNRLGGLAELVEGLKPESDAFAELTRVVEDPAWAFDPLFRATLAVYRRLPSDVDFQDRIVAFWGGDRIAVRDLKRQLRLAGYSVPDLRARRIAELAIPRFRFVAQLIAAAGYTGWVVLLDEVELVASLSLVARARSYAVLAALGGQLVGRSIPGLLMIGAVTDDFADEVLRKRRDEEKIEQKWANSDPALVAEVQAGIAFLRHNWERIRRPTPEGLRRTQDRVREIYAAAYGSWPAEAPLGEPGPQRSMRQHVRDWITRWDLNRLYPGYQPEIEVKEVEPDLSERPDLEATEVPEEDGAAAE